MIKNIAQLFLITLLIFSANSSVLSDDSFIVSGNPHAPPVVWEEQHNLSGVAPDLIEAIFNELSISYSIRIISDWDKVQRAAKAGEIDLIVSAYRNDERSNYLNFSIPYLPEPTVIVVKKGKKFTFFGWDSLKGKKDVSNSGESYGQKFDTFIKEHLDISYHPLERTLQVLNLGQADYLIIDLYTALTYARLLRGESSITILDPPVTVENFHIARASCKTHFISNQSI